ncbi:MAG: hypothetical protein ACLSB9_11180 [Hydrogeniiclostridium mannosilyticum]
MLLLILTLLLLVVLLPGLGLLLCAVQQRVRAGFRPAADGVGAAGRGCDYFAAGTCLPMRNGTAEQDQLKSEDFWKI